VNRQQLNEQDAMQVEISQSLYGDILYHAPDAIFIESLDGIVLDANLQACKLHGMSREELIGKSVLDLVPPDQRETVEKEFPNFARGSMEMYEGYSLHQSGRSIPVELITARVQYGGEPALMIHVRDISTRKALKESDALNDAIMQTLPGGVVRLDADKRIIWANDKAIKFLCLHHDAQQQYYVNNCDCQIVHEDNSVGDFYKDWPGFRCMDQLQRQEETVLGFTCGKCPTRWAVFSATPIVDQQTRLCSGAIVTFVDTTEQRNTMSALRESEYRFHLAFDHAPMGMVLATPHGKFLQINNRFCTMLGYRWAELISKNFFDIAHPDDHEICSQFAESLKNSQAARHSTRKRYLHRDGHEVWCQITVTIVRDQQGNPQYCINQIEDLTPQLKAEAQHQQLEERLRQSQKLQAIGTLASGVAHDFNNLLLAIESYVDMAQTQYKRNIDPSNALTNIRHAIRQSTGMTRSLLTFARQTSGNRQPLCLQDAVEQSLKTLRPLLPANIQIEVEDNSECPLEIHADPSEMQQLLMNLVVNARDAMPEGGTLTLRLETERCHGKRPLLHLWVCDSGVGMDDQTRQRIFDPFYTTKSRSQGTGLGLAVVHGIVTDHNARITVTSELGKGSKFKITFPAKCPVLDPNQTIHPIPTDQRHLILVQKDAMLRQVLGTMLNDQKILVHGVDTMAQFEKMLLVNEKLTCDLLVCDDANESLPTESLCRVLEKRQGKLRWVLMTDRNTPPTPMAYASQALLLRRPMPVRELAKHLTEILEQQR
jgi:PAS domain S-box-containing protein